MQPSPNTGHLDAPLLLVVADGLGMAPPAPSNAVSEAATATLDRLFDLNTFTTLRAHGTAVGLPSDDDMGNSEVGHNALGAGRVFAQGAKLVNQAISSGTLFEGQVWKEAIGNARRSTLHFLGLHSDGNVHSNTSHLYAMLSRAASQGVTRARVHILLDGRDVPERSALGYIDATERELQDLNTAFGVDFAIASGGGRMAITMDRYQADWQMVQRGYNTHVHGVARHFSSARVAVETMYAESQKGDQYLGQFVIVGDDNHPIGKISTGDSVIMFNFRGDRAIEISQAFEEANFVPFDRAEHGPKPEVYYAGMLQYDGDLQVPPRYLVNPPSIDHTMGEYLCANGLKSFAISETQKYGHVTYFWNGNKSGYIDESLETYVEIPSDRIEFDQRPAMKAAEITDATIDLLKLGTYQFGRLNFANGDMVGHTGNLAAAVKAIEAVDLATQRLLETIDELGGILIFTADHGNADIMFEEVDTKRTPKTSHTLNPVPFAIYLSERAKQRLGSVEIKEPFRLTKPPGLPNGGLSNVAATVFTLLGLEPPVEYDESLVKVTQPR